MDKGIAAESVCRIDRLSPHFVNNAFVMMQTLNRRQKNRELDAVLVHLSRIFHYLQKKNGIVELNDELDFIRHYLEIQIYRFGNRISYDLPTDTSGNIPIRQFSVFSEVASVTESVIEPSTAPGFISIRIDGAVFLDYKCGAVKEERILNVILRDI